ncbi:MAG: glycoside hydrolase family 2 protein [Phycisphaera sp.]|nr:glycoside hydrolase family 2 protein [Phycisphaera sp.]
MSRTSLASSRLTTYLLSTTSRPRIEPPPTYLPWRAVACFLSRIRSPMISRSNWANDSRMLSVTALVFMPRSRAARTRSRKSCEYAAPIRWLLEHSTVSVSTTYTQAAQGAIPNKRRTRYGWVGNALINGKSIATTDNMFRAWEWDIKELLKPGENSIEIVLASAVKFCEALAHKRGLGHLLYPNKIYAAIPGMMRKEPCNFGWDWGIKAVTCGIWRDIRVMAFDTARLKNITLAQDHSARGKVGLTIHSEIERLRDTDLKLRATIQLDGQTVTTVECAANDTRPPLTATITDPQLWWPNNLGQQPLYEITVELLDAEGSTLDTLHKRIGLRTLRLDRQPDAWGESFRFVVNGVPFFAKGANWVPADAVQSRMTPDRYRALVRDAAAVHMNMLRVWGGGLYEEDAFYDACDELGICVWQEFTFGGGVSPLDDPAFRDSVIAEAHGQVRRLRHHPCLALWCGNNEMEMGDQLQDQPSEPGKMSWKDYRELFDKQLARIVGDLHPGCDYWPSSPHSPHGDRRDYNNPTCGDAHLWAVWHEGKPFEWYRTCPHGFNSEFGCQSLREPKTVHSFTHEDDRNIASYIMEQHQRSHGNARIIEYMLAWFRMPNSFDHTLWLSQVLQGMSIKYAVEHWRRSMPRGMGTLYWQLNDCWPVASWSSIDYHGRWKALHHMARHFFAPLLVSGVEDVGKETVEVHVTSDLLEMIDAELRWDVTDIEGHPIEQGSQKVAVGAQSSNLIRTLDLGHAVQAHEKRGLLVWLELEAPGQPTSRNMVFFARPVRRPRVFSPRPKHLELSRSPGLETLITPKGNGSFDVTLTTARPALWVWLELKDYDAGFSDNFFHLRPGSPVTVNAQPTGQLTTESFAEQLLVRSLVDTYR